MRLATGRPNWIALLLLPPLTFAACDAGRVGSDIRTCQSGAFGPDCEPCHCGPGTCDDGLDGTGVCTCPAGTFGADCSGICGCENNATCNDGASGDGSCTCQPGTFGSDCAGVCACPTAVPCDDGALGSGDCVHDYAIDLRFERVDAARLSPFRVIATVTDHGLPALGESVGVTLDRGSAGAVTETGGGVYRFEVVPTQTGEHPVTVAVGDTSITRTPGASSAPQSGSARPSGRRIDWSRSRRSHQRRFRSRSGFP
jgi:hypothetical protein